MAVTALQLIKGSLRLLGEAGESQTLSAEDAENCLFALNEMMDQWALKRFMVHQIRQDLVSWPGGVASNTIGPAGDFNIPRPIQLEPGCFMKDSAGLDYPLEIITDRDEYDSILMKQLPVTQYAQAIYFEPSFPLGRLFLYPVPQQLITVAINSRQELQSFPDLTTLLSLPQGYQQCIRFNLALVLAPEFIGSRAPPAWVAAIAKQSMAAIAAINAPRLLAECETAYLHRGGQWDYDIRSGMQ